jgi:hypothetical protein
MLHVPDPRPVATDLVHEQAVMTRNIADCRDRSRQDCPESKAEPRADRTIITPSRESRQPVTS